MSAAQPSDGAHFIFEQALDRLDQLEFHVFRQPPDIVVALDYAGRVAIQRNAFQNIRINRSLAQEGGMDSGGGFSKDFDEFLADDFPLLFRIGDSLELIEEAVRGIDIVQVHGKGAGKDLLHFLGFVLA